MISLYKAKGMGSVAKTIENRSFQFALRIVKLCEHLRNEKKEYTLSKQLLRAGTSIGANVAEAEQAQSRLDFINKLSIALKEASETDYWIRLLYAAEYLRQKEYESIIDDCRALEKMLTSIIKTTKVQG